MSIGTLGKFGCCGGGGDVCIADVTIEIEDARTVPTFGTFAGNLVSSTFDGYYGYPDTFLAPASILGYVSQCIYEAQTMVNVTASGPPGTKKKFRQYKVRATGAMFEVTEANRYHHITNPTPTPITSLNEIVWEWKQPDDSWTPTMGEPWLSGEIETDCNSEPWFSGFRWDGFPSIRTGFLTDGFHGIDWKLQAHCQAVRLGGLLVCKFTRDFGWDVNGTYQCESPDTMEVVDFKKILVPDPNFDQFLDPVEAGTHDPGWIWGEDYEPWQEFLRFMASESSGEIFPTVGYNLGAEGYPLEPAPDCCDFDP